MGNKNHVTVIFVRLCCLGNKYITGSLAALGRLCYCTCYLSQQ